MAFQTEVAVGTADDDADKAAPAGSIDDDELMVIVNEARRRRSDKLRAEAALMRIGVPALERVVSPGRGSPDSGAMALARVRSAGVVDELGKAIEAHSSRRRSKPDAADTPESNAASASASTEPASSMGVRLWEQRLLGSGGNHPGSTNTTDDK
jgi:hypothetical protein